MIPNPETLRGIVEAATRRVNGEPPAPGDEEVLEVPWETVLQLAEALLSALAQLDAQDEWLRQVQEAARNGETFTTTAEVALRRDAIARVLLVAGGRA